MLKQDVRFIAQLALLSCREVDARSYRLLYDALQRLKIRHLLSGTGFEADQALKLVDRHTQEPLGTTVGEKGRQESARSWIAGQLRLRFEGAYLGAN
jgi:hypothetical protein